MAVLRRRLAVRRSQGAAVTAAEERSALNADLSAVLRGRMPRRRDGERRMSFLLSTRRLSSTWPLVHSPPPACVDCHFTSCRMLPRGGAGMGRCRRMSARSRGLRRPRSSTRCSGEQGGREAGQGAISSGIRLRQYRVRRRLVGHAEREGGASPFTAANDGAENRWLLRTSHD